MNEFEHLPVGGVHTGAARRGGGAGLMITPRAI